MTMVRFGDVIREVKINIDRTTDNHEFYIAGDHMDSENIHITRRGTFKDSDVGPAFIRLFKPGQILYGSRRTYLKKVAVADFEGITSNTTFVLETKDEKKLLQGLIPYIMLTERFTEYSIRKSKGSTNPYILFSDLADYSFDVPDIEEQKLLLTLLNACDRAKEAYKDLMKSVDNLVKSQFIEMFGVKANNGNLVTIADVCSNTMIGPFGSALHINETTEEGDVFVLGTDNAVDNRFNVYKRRYITEERYRTLSKYTVNTGDIIISMMGTIGRTAIIPDDFEKAIISSHLCCLTPDTNQIRTEFLNAILQLHDGVLGQINEQKKGSIMSGLNLKIIKGLSFSLPSLDEQDEFISFLKQSDKSKFVSSNRNLSRCLVIQ